MKPLPEPVAVLIIAASAFAVLYDPLVGWPDPAYRMGALYAAPAAGSLVMGFLQGLVLAPRRPVQCSLMGWLLAALAFITMCPQKIAWFQGCPTHERFPEWNFAPVLPWPGFAVGVFLLVCVPVLAALGIEHGSSFRRDRKMLRLCWLATVALTVAASLLLSLRLFDLLPEGLRWALIRRGF